jgi:hypothetical protein
VHAVEVVRLSAPRTAHDREELIRAHVTVIVIDQSPNRCCSPASPPVTTFSNARPFE